MKDQQGTAINQTILSSDNSYIIESRIEEFPDTKRTELLNKFGNQKLN